MSDSPGMDLNKLILKSDLPLTTWNPQPMRQLRGLFQDDKGNINNELNWATSKSQVGHERAYTMTKQLADDI